MQHFFFSKSCFIQMQVFHLMFTFCFISALFNVNKNEQLENMFYSFSNNNTASHVTEQSQNVISCLYYLQNKSYLMASMFPFWNHYFQKCKKSRKNYWHETISLNKMNPVRIWLTIPTLQPKKAHKTETERAEVLQPNKHSNTQLTPHTAPAAHSISHTQTQLDGVCADNTRWVHLLYRRLPDSITDTEPVLNNTRVFPAPPHSERVCACYLTHVIPMSPSPISEWK